MYQNFRSGKCDLSINNGDDMRICLIRVFSFFFLLLFWSNSLIANPKWVKESVTDREHDIIVLTGAELSSFLGQPVQELRLFQYQYSL